MSGSVFKTMVKSWFLLRERSKKILQQLNWKVFTYSYLEWYTTFLLITDSLSYQFECEIFFVKFSSITSSQSIEQVMSALVLLNYDLPQTWQHVEGIQLESFCRGSSSPFNGLVLRILLQVELGVRELLGKQNN